MITLQWAQGCNLKTHSAVRYRSTMGIEAKDFVVNIQAHLSVTRKKSQQEEEEEGGVNERASSRKIKWRGGCWCCFAVLGDWLQIILIIFRPLRWIRPNVNSTTGNGHLFPPSFYHPESLPYMFFFIGAFLSSVFLSCPCFLSFPYLSSPLSYSPYVYECTVISCICLC